jgi:integrase
MSSSGKVEESSTIEDPAAFEQRLADRELEVRKESIAENTRRGYDSDWRDFTVWCEEHGAEPLPADATTLKRYFIDRQVNLSKATLSRRIASISRFHKEAGHLSPTLDPTFRMVMGGIRRMKKDPTTGAKKALLVEDLKEILAQVDTDTPKGKRDRAMLLVGFAAALRRSELVALDREDIRFTREGLVLTLRKSKTDQENEGVEIGVPRGRKPATCPVLQLEAWLEELKIPKGPIFRRIRKDGKILPDRLDGRAVAQLVKSYVGHAGFEAKDFGGHSLRAGLATSAAMAGRSERQIMEQTRHKSEKMVRVYIRKGSLFKDNVVDSLGF